MVTSTASRAAHPRTQSKTSPAGTRSRTFDLRAPVARGGRGGGMAAHAHQRALTRGGVHPREVGQRRADHNTQRWLALLQAELI
jgi:hypothetical protein